MPDGEWGSVRSVIRTLANLHGDEGVRLVVWFDGSLPQDLSLLVGCVRKH